MKLELIKTKNNCYKIISTSNHKHPALEELATLLRKNNKHSKIKIGIYSIHGGEFSRFKTVYSYISQRAEKMNRSKFYKFIKGLVQMSPRKNMWKPVKVEEFNEDKYLIEE